MGLGELKARLSGQSDRDSRRSRNSELDEEDDKNVDAVIARNLWKNHKLFPPTSIFKHRWDLLMLVFVVYNSYFIPMALAFKIEQDLGHIVAIVTALAPAQLPRAAALSHARSSAALAHAGVMAALAQRPQANWQLAPMNAA